MKAQSSLAVARALLARALPFLALTAPAAPATGGDIAAGWTHSVAVKQGHVWAWGDNAYGQLGQPDAGRSLRPRPVPGVAGAVAVAASWHTLALDADGRVYAWGRNTHGQLGNGRCGTRAIEPRPIQVPGLADIVAIAAGWDHSLALTRAGAVYAWGSRSHGQLGDDTRATGSPVTSPRIVPGLTGIRAIAAGGQHSLALGNDGTLYAWGSNWNGQLGNGKSGASTHAAAPRAVIGPDGKSPLANVIAIAAGALHSVAATKDGLLYAWGYNGTGQIPSSGRGGFWGDEGRRNVPAPVAARSGAAHASGSVPAIVVAAGYESTYAVSAAGGVSAAGWSMYGELGSGSSGGNRDMLGPVLTGRRVTWQHPPPGTWLPALVYRYTDGTHAAEGVKDVEVVDAFEDAAIDVGDGPTGGERAAAITRNADQIETRATLLYPARARAGRPLTCLFSRLAFGAHDGDDDFAAHVRLRWTNAATGKTADLPLDAGTRAGARVLPELGGIVALAGGMHHALARDRDGQLWAWGHNGFGQLGDGSVTDRPVAQHVDPFDEATRPLAAATRPAPTASEPVPPTEKFTDVRAHGATGDGITLDQRALQRAIDDCARRGGGIVWFPPGTYLTGTLELRAGVRLHLDAGATILASTNREHYPEHALLHALNLHGAAITGQGVIDGQGHFVGARDWRHSCILMENCRDTLVEGVSTIHAGAWTQHYICCVGLTIRRVTVRSLRPGRNNDGIDLSGCENVRITGCTVISDDDAIVIKSQKAERVNRDIKVTDNICHTYRGAFKLGTETRGAYSNIACRGLTCYGAKALELYSVDGSESDGIVIDGVRAFDALVALNIRLGARLRPAYWEKGLEPKIGRLRNIRIGNVEAHVATRPWREILLEHGIPDAEWATARPENTYDSCVSGLPQHPIENVRIQGLKVTVPGGARRVPTPKEIPERPDVYPHAGNFGVLPAHGIFIRHARNVALHDAVFKTARPDVRPPVASHDAEALAVGP